jgi:hypothetical protein
MSRILLAAVVGVLLLGAPLAADQMLSNPDVAVDTNNTTTQDEFAETGATFVQATPILLAALVVGALLVAVRGVS